MKKVLFGLSMMLAASVFAAANDTTIYVWTNGPDKYADGTTVLDGERYALVWSATDFAGFNADGTLVNEADKIIEIAALAKGGKCRDHIFQIPAALAATLADGNYSLYLLDTRVFAEDGKVSFAKQDGTKIDAISAAVSATATIKVASLGASASAASDLTASTATAVPADAPSPVVKNITVDQAAKLVYIDVDNTVPYLTYDLKAGDAPNKLEAGKAKNPANGKAGETITLVKPIEGDSGFFKVDRK